MRRLVAFPLLSALVAATLTSATPAEPAQAQSPAFTDLDETLHAEAVELVADDGIADGWPDGTFRPRLDVRRDQMATFLARALELDEVPSEFPDVPDDSPHVDNIGAIADAGITQGFTDGTYRPRDFVTRGQMATFLAEGFDLEPGDTSFPDVPEDYVHAEGISALVSAGITDGYEDGTYRPNSLVKRDHMASFLASAVPLPREPEEDPDPCVMPTAAAAGQDGDVAARDDDPTTAETDEVDADADIDVAPDSPSPDLEELEHTDRLAELESADEATFGAASITAPEPTELGEAVPGLDVPLTSALRTSDGDLAVHTFGRDPSMAALVDDDGEVSSVTDVPAGTRTWAAAEAGDHVYLGQWGPGTRDGATNLFRYPADGSAANAQAVATVPSGNEFWGLASDDRDRLWAGTRAVRDPQWRDEVGMAINWRDDRRHVVHRIDPQRPSASRVTDVLFCAPGEVDGTRPDVKQVATAGDTVYVGTGQLPGKTHLYAFEPGTRTLVPTDDVRDLTPSGVQGATSIYAMEADEDHVVFGTQGSSDDATRLVALVRSDSGNEAARVNVPLPDETRIDAVDVRDGQLVATGNSGRIYEVEIPDSRPALTDPEADGFTEHEAPVPDQFSRYVELTADGTVLGVTNRGLIWATGAVDEEYEVHVLAEDERLDPTPGVPHSLHAGTQDLAVGANSAMALRSADTPDDDPRLVGLAGEVKAMTADEDGATFAATYPNAQLWTVPAGGDDAEQLGGWTSEFTRPADVDHDPRTDRVLVIAREEANARSDPRDAPRNNVQYRPSELFSLDPDADVSAERTSGIELRRPSQAGGTAVEASRLLVGDTDDGSEVYVGDTFGGVQRIDAETGDRDWYWEPDEDTRDRPVVGLDLVDDELIVTISGQVRIDGDHAEPRTVIVRLDPEDGDTLGERHVVSDRWAVSDALSAGDLTIMASASLNRVYDRATGDGPESWEHERSGGAAVWAMRLALSDDCRLYHFADQPAELWERQLDTCPTD